MSPNHQPPSPDIYPGLDEELEAVYKRNVAEGLATSAEELPATELETVVHEELHQHEPESTLPEATRRWAVEELIAARYPWERYRVHVANLPTPPSQIGELNPNFGRTITRLHEAWSQFITGSEETPGKESLGEAMHLVLIPWEDFRSHIGLGHFQEWLKGLRTTQGVASETEDYINEALIVAIEMNKPMYRDPDNPAGELLTPKAYLDKKIAQDGPWGIMLMQTSDQAGAENLRGKSPDEMTTHGKGHLTLAGHNVDAMGIFEWLALTFQENPSKLSTDDYSWFLANRLDVDGVPHVPISPRYDDRRVRSLLGFARDADFAWRPRLAVA
ncbi:MAG: hypothetical protein Q7R60_02710 [bacterium]|nr:hypothetical protein [bacterium]